MRSKPIITELQIKGKRYFHITCECRYRTDEFYKFYSVLHEWDRLEEWKEMLRRDHECPST